MYLLGESWPSAGIYKKIAVSPHRNHRWALYMFVYVYIHIYIYLRCSQLSVFRGVSVFCDFRFPHPNHPIHKFILGKRGKGSYSEYHKKRSQAERGPNTPAPSGGKFPSEVPTEPSCQGAGALARLLPISPSSARPFFSPCSSPQLRPSLRRTSLPR